jgi:hypothetical protein
MKGHVTFNSWFIVYPPNHGKSSTMLKETVEATERRHDFRSKHFMVHILSWQSATSQNTVKIDVMKQAVSRPRTWVTMLAGPDQLWPADKKLDFRQLLFQFWLNGSAPLGFTYKWINSGRVAWSAACYKSSCTSNRFNPRIGCLAALFSQPLPLYKVGAIFLNGNIKRKTGVSSVYISSLP